VREQSQGVDELRPLAYERVAPFHCNSPFEGLRSGLLDDALQCCVFHFADLMPRLQIGNQVSVNRISRHGLSQIPLQAAGSIEQANCRRVETGFYNKKLSASADDDICRRQPGRDLYLCPFCDAPD